MNGPPIPILNMPERVPERMPGEPGRPLNTSQLLAKLRELGKSIKKGSGKESLSEREALLAKEAARRDDVPDDPPFFADPRAAKAAAVMGISVKPSFAKPTSSTRLPATTRKDHFQEDIRPLELAGIVVPNPIIRPLEHKLAPRDEYTYKPSRSSCSSSTVASPISIARHRGQASLSLCGSAPDRSPKKKSSNESQQPTLVASDTASSEVTSSDTAPSDTAPSDTALPALPDAAQSDAAQSENVSPDLPKVDVNIVTLGNSPNDIQQEPRPELRLEQISLYDDLSAIQEEENRDEEIRVQLSSEQAQARHQQLRDDISPTVILQNRFSICTLDYDRLPSLHMYSVAVKLGDNDDEETEFWAKYLEPYHKGEYNLSKPPRMEIPESSEYPYLPAVYPANEIDRMAIFRQFEGLWEEYGHVQSERLPGEAANHFGVEFAAISLFDENFEIRKHEFGNYEGKILRSTSLTAHVLYSTEVLVVMDPESDWRFARNPVVVGWPQMRFFAVAPMVVDELVIGSFAIFDRFAREIFTYKDRMKLVSYAAQSMKEMIKRYEWIKKPEIFRSTPLLERESQIFGTYDTPPSNGKPRTVSKKFSRMKVDPRATANVHTPPASSEDNRNFGEDLTTSLGRAIAKRSFTVPINHVRRLYSCSDTTSVNDDPSPTPVVRGSASFESAPFREPTVAQFLRLEDEDVCEHPECGTHEQEGDYCDESSLVTDHTPTQPVLQPQPGPPPKQALPPPPAILKTRPSVNFKRPSLPSQSSMSSLSTEKIFGPETPTLQTRRSMKFSTAHLQPRVESASDDDTEEDDTPTPRRPLRPKLSTSNIPSLQPAVSSTSTTIPTLKTKSSFTPPSYQAVATAECATIVKTLGFDIVYCINLEAITVGDYTSDTDLLANNWLFTKTLACYPSCVPRYLSREFHLKVLRQGGQIWTNPLPNPPAEEYTTGVMIPLLTPGLSEHRTDGVLLGAFRFGSCETTDLKDLAKASGPLPSLLEKEGFRERVRERERGGKRVEKKEVRGKEYFLDLKDRVRVMGKHPPREGPLIMGRETDSF